MFSKRRNGKNLAVELYAQFRQNHGADVASGTSPPIHLSPLEARRLVESHRAPSIDSNGYETLLTTTPGVPSLSNGSVVSPDNQGPASPLTYLTDVFASDGTTSEQDYAHDFYQSAYAPLDLSHSNSPAEKNSMDYQVPDQLLASEQIRGSFPNLRSFGWLKSPLLPPSIDRDDMDLVPKDDGNTDRSSDFMESLVDENAFSGTTSETDQPREMRFRHMLEAPPALRKQSEQSLVTYLNKGSRYSLLVEDTAASASNSPTNRLYCTSIQVAFDTEDRRERPLASWQLWDQSRGADEGHLFNGRFQAIEFVDSIPTDGPVQNISKVQVVHSDGFSLVWGADCDSLKECSIKFQLNFLSTDFSHVKGIHGVSMQLCCKTEEISTNSIQSPIDDNAISYCRIQVFRSHGAERKMSNDLATVGKRITRLKQQLSRSEVKSKEKSNRKHKRKPSSVDVPKRIRALGSVQEDVLRSRIQSLESSCISTTSHSLLDQQGEKQQHCDWYPSKHRPQQGSSHGPGTAGGTGSTADYNGFSSISCLESMKSENAAPSPHPFSQRIEESWHATSSPIVPTPQDGTSDVVCFHVRPMNNEAYTPIYLASHTAHELTAQVAAALGVNPTKVFRSIWLCDKGFKIIVDDDVVLSMKKGQGMRVAVNNIGSKFGRNPRELVGSQNGVEELCELVLEF